jgi:predicted nucleic acid-binding protein
VITYLDASVILRRLLQQPGPTLELGPTDETISSSLAQVECFRALDRLRLLGAMDEIAQVRSRMLVYQAFESCEVLEPGEAVLERAAMPFPSSLKTLDAIHIATALVYREATGNPIRMATHDRALARACRAMGLEVIGAA